MTGRKRIVGNIDTYYVKNEKWKLCRRISSLFLLPFCHLQNYSIWWLGMGTVSSGCHCECQTIRKLSMSRWCLRLREEFQLFWFVRDQKDPNLSCLFYTRFWIRRVSAMSKVRRWEPWCFLFDLMVTPGRVLQALGTLGCSLSLGWRPVGRKCLERSLPPVYFFHHSVSPERTCPNRSSVFAAASTAACAGRFQREPQPAARLPNRKSRISCSRHFTMRYRYL